MKNTIIKYDTRDVDTYTVSDYFSKDISIADILLQYPDYLAIYQTQNNDKLERISYELYGTTDYWDILLMLNSRDPLFNSVSYDFDIIEDNAKKQIKRYADKFFSEELKFKENGQSDERGDVLVSQLIDDLQEENERIRSLYVVKKDKMGSVLLLLKKLSKI